MFKILIAEDDLELQELFNNVLTKNGYGSMVVMSIQSYENMMNNIESKLDEADRMAEFSEHRLSHDEVFADLRSKMFGEGK